MAVQPNRSGRSLGFRVGQARLAVPAETVAEVVRRPALTRVPHAPASLLGLAQLRGATVPVVSLARLMGGEDAAATSASRLLLIEADEPLAIAVDEVGAVSTGRGETRPGQVVLQAEDGAAIDVLALLRRDFGKAARRGPRAGAAAPAAAAPQAAQTQRVALMTIILAGQAYALPLDQVIEVLGLPAQLSIVPGADAAVLGMMAHRGRLLPLVSLRGLLGLQGEPAPGSQVVMTRLGKAMIGFVADRLGSILRVAPEALAPIPSVLNRGAGEAQIQSICRLDDGRGLVSILSAERLFRSGTVAAILAEAGQGDHQMAEQTSRAVEQILVFTLGEEAYGLPIAAVEEVLAMPERLTRVPRAPAFVEGVTNIRGTVVPVIDQRRRFQAPGAPPTHGRRLIVTRIDERPAAFVVDAVTEIVQAPADRIAPSPALTAEAARLFDRVATLELDGRMILLVDPRELLDRAERDLLSEMRLEAADPAAR